MRPYESPGPSRGSIAPVSQAHAPSQALSCPKPTAGKKEGWAVVLRREWPCRLLLWTGGDAAPGGWDDESGNLLPRRPAHGAPEGLRRGNQPDLRYEENVKENGVRITSVPFSHKFQAYKLVA